MASSNLGVLRRDLLSDFCTPLQLNYYIHSLDGIRAVAMLIVILSHTGYGNIVPGRAGVTIFFFLSGYLITTLMLGEYETKGTIKILKFYSRRFIRLLPPILVILPTIYILTYFGLIPGQANLTTFFGQLFYSANYLEIFSEDLQKPTGTVVLWSLAIEEHFYILYPLILLPLLRKISYEKILILFGIICIITLSWRFYLAGQPDFVSNRNAFGTDTRADSILFGCMLALTRLTHINRERVDLHYMSFKAFLLFWTSGLLFLSTLTFRDEFIRETIRYTIQGIALAGLFYFPIVYWKHPLFKILENPIMKKLGVFSYVMYLVHFPLHEGLVAHFGTLRNSAPLATAITIILSAFIAWLIDVYIDKPLKKYRVKLR